MTLKRVLSSTAAVAILAAAPAFGQALDDVSLDQIRIETNDCQFGACVSLQAMSEADAIAAIADITAEREAAIAAAGSGNGSPDGNRGRGLALGQQDNSAQVVFLEFNPGAPTFEVFSTAGVPFALPVLPDYIYTQDDRDFIQERLEADYAPYNFVFTQEEPSSGEFTTLTFGDNDGNPIILDSGILFGLAENIDFGNDGRSDNAFVDASFWQFLAELDANFGTQNLQTFLVLPEPLTLEEVEEFRQIAVVNQSANTGSHELGHILGLRHHDSFGAPGDGLPPARDPGEFIPVGEVDENGLETLQHIMASGASAGLPLSSPPFVDRFFGERSAVKLALNGRTRVIDEETAAVTGGRLGLKRVVSPNPVLEGVNSGGKLDIEAVLVSGSISAAGEVDTYDFAGDAGAIFNAEIISSSDISIVDDVFALIELSLQQPDGSFEVISANRLTFEGLEPLIFDFTLPADGEYRLSVSAPQLFTFDSGATVDLVPIFGTGFLTGDYELLAYVVEGGNGKGPRKLPGPRR